MKFQDVLFFQNSIFFLVFRGGGRGEGEWEGCKTPKNDPITNFNLSDSISQEL